MARHWTDQCVSTLFVLVFLASSGMARAASEASEISGICEIAAVKASQKYAVPLNVLRAISLTETGRRMNGEIRPWPWTINMEGKGKWFDDRKGARSYVDRHFERGARSFDVGCFQINYRWHGEHFESLTEMFDPQINADYAAKFLAELFDEFGDWSRAAGAYHSRTPKYANKYRARFNRLIAGLSPEPVLPEATRVVADIKPKPTKPRSNSFPLLQVRTSRAAFASLVPLPQDAPQGRFLQIGGN